MDLRRVGVLVAVFGLAAMPLLLLGHFTLSLSSTAVQEEAKRSIGATNWN